MAGRRGLPSLAVQPSTPLTHSQAAPRAAMTRTGCMHWGQVAQRPLASRARAAPMEAATAAPASHPPPPLLHVRTRLALHGQARARRLSSGKQEQPGPPILLRQCRTPRLQPAGGWVSVPSGDGARGVPDKEGELCCRRRSGLGLPLQRAAAVLKGGHWYICSGADSRERSCTRSALAGLPPTRRRGSARQLWLGEGRRQRPPGGGRLQTCCVLSEHFSARS